MTTVAEYVERVRAELGDLPSRARDELLEDLPEHLAEVAASGDEPLESLVGSPEAYAAELRAAANLETPARRAAVVGQVRDRLRAVDTKVGPLIGYASASEFGRQLRPAWWVIRGYLAAMVIAIILTRGGEVGGLVPRLTGSTLLGWAIIAVSVLASIRLGQRSDRLSTAPRVAIGVVTAVLAFAGLAGLFAADQRWQMAGYVPQTVSYDQYSYVRDVYVYDKDGRLLRDVILVDQNGMPIMLGDTDMRCAGPDRREVYPRCPEQAPPLLRPWTLESHPSSPTPSPSGTG